jgi:WD40 repeat protein
MLSQSNKIYISVALFIAFFLLVTKLEAYQPLISIGKPNLIDICYTPDGRFLATLTSNYVEFLNAETMSPAFRINVNVSDSYHLALSPDSSLMAIPDWMNGIQVWQIPTKTILTTIPAKTYIAEFSPDGKYLAYTNEDSVFLWDVEQKKVIKELTGDPQPKLERIDRLSIYSIAFHPNSKILAVGSTRATIVLWDIETGKIISHLKTGYEDYTENIHYSHDGNLLAFVTSGIVKLWNFATGESRFVEFTSDLDEHDVSFTLDDQHLLIGEGNGELHIINLANYELEKRPVIDPLPSPDSHNFDSLSSLTLHPDGNRFACRFNGSKIIIWNVNDFSISQKYYGWGHSWYAQAIYIPETNRVVSGLWTNELYFWDAKTGELMDVAEFNMPVWMMKGSPDGKKIAFVNLNDTVQIWDAVAVKQIHAFEIGGAHGTRAIEFSPSGKYLARSGWWKGTYVWDVETGEEINQMGYGDDPVLLFTLDEQEIIVVNSEEQPENGKTVFWDIKTGKIVREFDRAGPIVNVGDDYIQASRTEDGVDVVLLNSNKLLCKIPAKPELRGDWFIRNYLNFNPSGSILVVNYWGDINNYTKYEFYNAWTGELLTTLSDIDDFCFTDDGKHIFLIDSKNGLGLYQLSDILGVPVPTAVNPSGKEITTMGWLKQNRLLQNYPNPFNPETWIPYQLGEDADVVIKIYSSSGKLVRTINVGLKSAGLYLNRENAIYWDGRDDSGEKVVSDEYFYTLKTSKFTDTKKMVIIR